MAVEISEHFIVKSKNCKYYYQYTLCFYRAFRNRNRYAVVYTYLPTCKTRQIRPALSSARQSEKS